MMAYQPQNPQSPPPSQPKKHTVRNIGIGVAVVVVILIIVAAATQPGPSVKITAVNIQVQLTGAVNKSFLNTYLGNASMAEGSTVSVSVPFSWPPNETCSITLEGISSQTQGFTVSASPIPVTLHPGDNVTLTVTITAPNHAYTGTLDLYMPATVTC